MYVGGAVVVSEVVFHEVCASAYPEEIEIVINGEVYIHVLLISVHGIRDKAIGTCFVN